jgi:hypothetical protein
VSIRGLNFDPQMRVACHEIVSTNFLFLICIFGFVSGFRISGFAGLTA